MNLDEILKQHGLPRAMIVRPDDRSGWMAPLAMQASMWCSSAGASFAILEDGRMQAVAIQAEVNVVGVYAGMFWMLCRIASVATARGIYPVVEGGADPEWLPDIERSLKIPRELLDETDPYDWEIESISWRDAGDRQVLYYHLISVLFRFVVFHEIGHINNDHIIRRKTKESSPLHVDRLGPKLIEPEFAIPSQAREIIADAYAMRMTIETLHSDLANHEGEELVKITRKGLVRNKSDLVTFVLTIINIYFRVADRSDWADLPLDRLSHPPAPFRMKATLAYLMEVLPLGINLEEAELAIKTAISGSDAIMSVMLDIFPTPVWYESIATNEHNHHFTRIYEECPRWSGKM